MEYLDIEERNLIDLYDLRRRYIKEGYHPYLIDEINEDILKKEFLLNENGGMTSATGGLSIGASPCSVGISSPGLGPVSSSQPSMFSGSTIDPAFSAGGGRSGSGDIGFPLNMGPQGVYSKIPAPGRNKFGRSTEHGGKAAKRYRREKKLNMATLKNIFANRPKYGSSDSSPEGERKSPRVLNFDNFTKSQFSKVTKLNQ